MAAGQTQEEALKRFQAQPSEAEALAPLESQRTQAAQYINPQEQQYRPTVGQKILRGLQGVARGGVLGPLAVDYNAPNRQYGRDVAAQTSRVGGIDQQINEARKAWEDASGRIGKEAGLARDVATSYADVGKQIAEQEQAELAAKKAEGTEAKTPTTAEGLAVSVGKQLFPNDPQAQMDYVQKHQFIDANHAGQIAEAEARRADIASRAAERGDNAAANRANQAFSRYQTQLGEYNSRKAVNDFKGQTDQSRLDAEREKALKDASEDKGGIFGIGAGQSDADKIRADYDARQKKLDAAIAKADTDLGDRPQMPAELSAPRGKANATPSPVAPTTPAASKADTYTYKGSTYTKGQVVPVDGKPHIITGFNAKTGKLQTKPQ